MDSTLETISTPYFTTRKETESMKRKVELAELALLGFVIKKPRAPAKIEFNCNEVWRSFKISPFSVTLKAQLG